MRFGNCLCNQLQETIHGDNTPLNIASESLKKRKLTNPNSIRNVPRIKLGNSPKHTSRSIEQSTGSLMWSTECQLALWCGQPLGRPRGKRTDNQLLVKLWHLSRSTGRSIAVFCCAAFSGRLIATFSVHLCAWSVNWPFVFIENWTFTSIFELRSLRYLLQ